ncbi:MAG: DUF4405 domain-containing protein [Ruminococcus flavefaciens]|nr:DUF4405 domain-containing protein [Ruminococcus flavefaciens]
MKTKMKVKLVTDIAMTAALLLMGYELVGQAAHEWIGVAMFLLFILHHVLNSHWSGSLLKGKYMPMRILQTALVLLILLSMFGSMFSGIILSRHVFSFVSIKGFTSLARNLHMTCAYWGFVFMALHLGFHWNMMISMAGKLAGKPSAARTWGFRITAAVIAGYGVYAFIHRDIGSYMLLKNQFVFFDFEEPFIFFLLDYMAVMGLFVFIGHYSAGLLRHWKRKGEA